MPFSLRARRRGGKPQRAAERRSGGRWGGAADTEAEAAAGDGERSACVQRPTLVVLAAQGWAPSSPHRPASPSHVSTKDHPPGRPRSTTPVRVDADLPPQSDRPTRNGPPAVPPNTRSNRSRRRFVAGWATRTWPGLTRRWPHRHLGRRVDPRPYRRRALHVQHLPARPRLDPRRLRRLPDRARAGRHPSSAGLGCPIRNLRCLTVLGSAELSASAVAFVRGCRQGLDVVLASTYVSIWKCFWMVT